MEGTDEEESGCNDFDLDFDIRERDMKAVSVGGLT